MKELLVLYLIVNKKNDKIVVTRMTKENFLTYTQLVEAECV